MRTRTLALVLAVSLVVAAVALTGCGQLIGNAVKGAVEKGTGVKVDEKSGEVTIQGKDGSGTVTVGGTEGKLAEGFPAEFPVYAGATVKASAKVSTPDGAAYTAEFTTTDDAGTVMSTMKEKLTGAGYTIENEVQSSNDGKTGGVITANKGDQKAVVTVTSESGETKIAVIITVKNQ